MDKPRIQGNGYWVQGVFNPVHKRKYNGSWPITYRSRPELLVMKWMDSQRNVLRWSSESVVIPYRLSQDDRLRKYFVDFSCDWLNADGTVTKLLIEYKPKHKTVPPKKGRKSDKTYLNECLEYNMNQTKWKYANVWAQKHGYKFLVISEDSIGLPVYGM